jgi:putative tricarboxylic transport membrane protein
MRFKTSQRLLVTAALMTDLLSASVAQAEIDSIHFLIPVGAGGGWDVTARGTGEALTKSGLIENASYENMSGGGGGKAIAHLIETADQANATPIAATIGDFGAFVVRADSNYQNLVMW